MTTKSRGQAARSGVVGAAIGAIAAGALIVCAPIAIADGPDQATDQGENTEDQDDPGTKKDKDGVDPGQIANDAINSLPRSSGNGSANNHPAGTYCLLVDGVEMWVENGHVFEGSHDIISCEMARFRGR